MNTSEILTHIDDKIARLRQVKALLTGEQTKRNTASKPVSKSAKKTAPAKKRSMSAEGRARIAAAQKARWAKSKKAAGLG